MATRATRKQFGFPADAPSNRSTPPIAKRGAIAGAKVGLSPRVVLGDIGNRVAEPPVWAAYKRSAVEGSRRPQPTVGHAPARSRGDVVTRRSLRMTLKKDVLPPAPNPTPEPSPEPQTELSQPKPQSPSPTEESRCAPTDEMMCQAFSHVTHEPGDLDVEDVDDAYLCSSYVKDIYKYMRHLKENKCKYLAGQQINRNMRAVVIDWLAKVHTKFNLQEETLVVTVAIIDHFLQDDPVPKTNLQLFQICQMEMAMLKALDFLLGSPLPPHLLRKASKVAEVDSKQYVLAKYLMQLCIEDYDMDHFPSSRIAAAVFCLPLKLLNGCELLPSLQHCMFYTQSDLLPIMQHMAKNVVLVNKGVATGRQP